jgi:hypothetical protein
MEARWMHMKDNLGREASLITRVAKGHVARNRARMLAADLERERQLAFLDLQAQLDVVGAYEFDPDEDDADDVLEQDEKGQELEDENEELDFGDDATPRAVTKWYGVYTYIHIYIYIYIYMYVCMYVCILYTGTKRSSTPSDIFRTHTSRWAPTSMLPPHAASRPAHILKSLKYTAISWLTF